MKIEYSLNGIDINGELIPWTIVDAERNKLRFSTSVLVKIGTYYSRDYYYEEFIMEQKEWAALKARMMGKSIYLGEIAGKHSEVELEVTDEAIKETIDLSSIISFFERSGWSSGNADVRTTFEENEEDYGE